MRFLGPTVAHKLYWTLGAIWQSRICWHQTALAQAFLSNLLGLLAQITQPMLWKHKVITSIQITIVF